MDRSIGSTDWEGQTLEALKDAIAYEATRVADMETLTPERQEDIGQARTALDTLENAYWWYKEAQQLCDI